MKIGSGILPLLLGVAFALLAGTALATDGYFSHGYGMKAKGEGGAAITSVDDAFGGANNPATMVFAGSRLDVGVDWFSPHRSAARTGSIGGAFDFSADSDSNNFYIPELGYNHLLSPDMSLGVSIYGNGGMNTNYPGGVASCGQPGRPANGLCGQGGLGVDLTQLLVAPTFSMKTLPQQSFGIAPLFAYQRFRATGLQAFDNAPGFPPFTGSPGSVTNNGYAHSTGFGVRLGYYARIDALSLGAMYTSKMRMGKFDQYKGLFAEQGRFDIPEHYAVGAGFDPAQGLNLRLDFERIVYSGVPSVHNPSSNRAPLGADNGPGFGWQDVNVIKLGAQWVLNPAVTLRAGYNHCNNPIQAQDVTFNILAPGVVKNHYTLGATFALGTGSELTLAYMHAQRNSTSGASMFNSPGLAGPGNGGTETISMYEDSLGIAWGLRF